MAIAPTGRANGPDRHLMVSSRLRERRHALELTQKQVVTRLVALGVTSTNKSLSSLEHGAGIDVGKLPELAAALECTVTYLLGLTDDPRSWQPDGSPSRSTRQPSSRASGSSNRASSARTRASAARREAGSGGDDATPDGDGTQAGWILGPYVPEHPRGRRS